MTSFWFSEALFFVDVETCPETDENVQIRTSIHYFIISEDQDYDVGSNKFLRAYPTCQETSGTLPDVM